MIFKKKIAYLLATPWNTYNVHREKNDQWGLIYGGKFVNSKQTSLVQFHGQINRTDWVMNCDKSTHFLSVLAKYIICALCSTRPGHRFCGRCSYVADACCFLPGLRATPPVSAASLLCRTLFALYPSGASSSALVRKSHLCISFLGIARPRSPPNFQISGWMDNTVVSIKCMMWKVCRSPTLCRYLRTIFDFKRQKQGLLSYFRPLRVWGLCRFVLKSQRE